MKIIVVSLLVYLVVGFAAAAYLLKGKTNPGPSQSETAQPRAASHTADLAQRPAALASMAEPVQVASPAPVRPVLSQEQQAKVNRAIDRGVLYLKGQMEDFHRDRLQLEQAQYSEGLVSLMALTLLECGVSADDPMIRSSAFSVRKAAPRMVQTYSLSLAILFLDRLGVPEDGPLIQTFALRLIAGQNPAGSWTYVCPILNSTEEQQLVTFLKTLDYADPNAMSDAATLPPKLRRIVEQQDNFVQVGFGGDNSNTQFALLALWVAQRQGLPAQPSLARVDRYFRGIQNPDGSWGYSGRSKQWRDSMTCAGLLGLAVGRSVLKKPRADGKETPEKDEAITNGFRYLAQSIETPEPVVRDGGGFIGADAHGDLYYLWSLERVAMVYDLSVIGGKDWYAWASQEIVKAQRPGGSWEEGLPGAVDTSFALLILKRVNVAKDLTSNIKKLVNIKELEGIKSPTGKRNP